MAREEIPKQAKRMFKGQIFDVFQWEQKMYDGSYKTFELLKRPNTVQVLAVVKDKILLLEQEQPEKGVYLSLPDGRVEGNEDELTAAQRELLEETGFESKSWIEWQRFQPMVKVVFDVVIYIAVDCLKVAEQNLDEGEKIKWKLVSLDELLALTDDREVFKQQELAMLFMDMRLHTDKKEAFRKLLWPDA